MFLCVFVVDFSGGLCSCVCVICEDLLYIGLILRNMF